MNKVLYNIIGVCLSLFFILISIFHSSNDVDFYINQYEENNTMSMTGMSLEDLEKTTLVLIDYLNDFSKEKTLDLEVTEFNEKVNVFDDRETMHMVDVQVLYQNFLKLTIALFIFVILGYFYLYKKEKSSFLKNLFKSYKSSLVLTIIVLIILGVVFALNFNWFWVNFHHVFFTNDLWLLDARISTMINMFPLEFFYSICVNILMKILGLSSLFFAFSYYLNKKFSK